MSVYSDALACGANDWGHIWGDPLIPGVVFVLGYGVVGWMLLRGARHSSGRDRLLWRICGVVFLFQMLNTPLDLHAMLLTGGRCLAHAQGWYDNRDFVQLQAIKLVLAVAVTMLLACVIFFRASLIRNAFLITGTGMVLGITILKGVDYPGFETTLNANYGPLRGADMFELTGLALALLPAIWRHFRTRT